MQEAANFPLDIWIIAREEDIKKYIFPLMKGERIFFSWDLWSGKTTFIRALLRNHFGDPKLNVRSPTYTYFEKYGENIYHFDLYRLDSVEDFFLIGWSDILDDPMSICLIEWPELLSSEYQATLRIVLEKINDTKRKITFHRQKSIG